MLIYKLDKFDICQFLFGNNNRALPFIFFVIFKP